MFVQSSPPILSETISHKASHAILQHEASGFESHHKSSFRFSTLQCLHYYLYLIKYIGTKHRICSYISSSKANYTYHQLKCQIKSTLYNSYQISSVVTPTPREIRVEVTCQQRSDLRK